MSVKIRYSLNKRRWVIFFQKYSLRLKKNKFVWEPPPPPPKKKTMVIGIGFFLPIKLVQATAEMSVCTEFEENSDS